MDSPSTVSWDHLTFTTGTNSTASDLPGPGRTFGRLISVGGRRVDAIIGHTAQRFGHGPNVVVVRMLCGKHVTVAPCSSCEPLFDVVQARATLKRHPSPQFKDVFAFLAAFTCLSCRQKFMHSLLKTSELKKGCQKLTNFLRDHDLSPMLHIALCHVVSLVYFDIRIARIFVDIGVEAILRDLAGRAQLWSAGKREFVQLPLARAIECFTEALCDVWHEADAEESKSEDEQGAKLIESLLNPKFVLVASVRLHCYAAQRFLHAHPTIKSTSTVSALWQFLHSSTDLLGLTVVRSLLRKTTLCIRAGKDPFSGSPFARTITASLNISALVPTTSFLGEWVQTLDHIDKHPGRPYRLTYAEYHCAQGSDPLTDPCVVLRVDTGDELHSSLIQIDAVCAPKQVARPSCSPDIDAWRASDVAGAVHFEPGRVTSTGCWLALLLEVLKREWLVLAPGRPDRTYVPIVLYCVLCAPTPDLRDAVDKMLEEYAEYVRGTPDEGLLQAVRDDLDTYLPAAADVRFPARLPSFLAASTPSGIPLRLLAARAIASTALAYVRWQRLARPRPPSSPGCQWLFDSFLALPATLNVADWAARVQTRVPALARQSSIARAQLYRCQHARHELLLLHVAWAPNPAYTVTLCVENSAKTFIPGAVKQLVQGDEAEAGGTITLRPDLVPGDIPDYDLMLSRIFQAGEGPSVMWLTCLVHAHQSEFTPQSHNLAGILYEALAQSQLQQRNESQETFVHRSAMNSVDLDVVSDAGDAATLVESQPLADEDVARVVQAAQAGYAGLEDLTLSRDFHSKFDITSQGPASPDSQKTVSFHPDILTTVIAVADDAESVLHFTAQNLLHPHSPCYIGGSRARCCKMADTVYHTYTYADDTLWEHDKEMQMRPRKVARAAGRGGAGNIGNAKVAKPASTCDMVPGNASGAHLLPNAKSKRHKERRVIIVSGRGGSGNIRKKTAFQQPKSGLHS